MKNKKGWATLEIVVVCFVLAGITAGHFGKVGTPVDRLELQKARAWYSTDMLKP